MWHVAVWLQGTDKLQKTQRAKAAAEFPSPKDKIKASTSIQPDKADDKDPRPGQKKCCVCLKWKDKKTAFWIDASRPDRKQPRCKECHTEATVSSPLVYVFLA
jgi:hypothetical protein